MADRIKARKIAAFLKQELIGKDMAVSGICASVDARENKVSFLRKLSPLEAMDARTLFIIDEHRPIDPKSKNSYIKIKNPRLAFAKVVKAFFTEKRIWGIAKSAKIGKDVVIAGNISIGENCVIEDNVSIGPDTVINHNVVIAENTIIGKNCYIKSGSVIGEDGFGFDFEEDKTPVRIPHKGRVVIHDNVEIGAHTTIARGTIQDTVINDNVKIDDHAFIAHNCIIGKNTLITACAEVSGSVVIGENCWLAPNCSIINKVKIGNNVKIGIGAIITKDIQDNSTIMGLESLSSIRLVRFKKRIKYGD